MLEQQLLPALIGLPKKLLTQGEQAVIGFTRKRVSKILFPRYTSVYQLRTEMIDQSDAHVRYPIQFSNGVPHIAGHQKGEIRRAPISGQAELNFDPVIFIDLYL